MSTYDGGGPMYAISGPRSSYCNFVAESSGTARLSCEPLRGVVSSSAAETSWRQKPSLTNLTRPLLAHRSNPL
eukprot:4542214-Prymnesium_polylepis.1